MASSTNPTTPSGVDFENLESFLAMDTPDPYDASKDYTVSSPSDDLNLSQTPKVSPIRGVDATLDASLPGAMVSEVRSVSAALAAHAGSIRDQADRLGEEVGRLHQRTTTIKDEMKQASDAVSDLRERLLDTTSKFREKFKYVTKTNVARVNEGVERLNAVAARVERSNERLDSYTDAFRTCVHRMSVIPKRMDMQINASMRMGWTYIRSTIQRDLQQMISDAVHETVQQAIVEHIKPLSAVSNVYYQHHVRLQMEELARREAEGRFEQERAQVEEQSIQAMIDSFPPAANTRAQAKKRKRNTDREECAARVQDALSHKRREDTPFWEVHKRQRVTE